jgi:hypothetical protein
MTHPVSALVCAIVGILLVWLGFVARRREAGIEGKVMMFLSGGMFLLASGAYAVLSLVGLLT